VITRLNSPYETHHIPTHRDTGVIVFYGPGTNGVPLASKIIILDEIYRPWGMENPDDTLPDTIVLSITDHVFSMSDFEKVELPVYINNERDDTLTPIYARDGTTILVPFRQIYRSAANFGNFAYLTPDGQLNFGESAGSSSDSLWTVGSTVTWYVGGQENFLTMPPIIVDGVIYVPLLSAFAQAAPYTGVRLFKEKIDIYRDDYT
jgi:hypothetical protein